MAVHPLVCADAGLAASQNLQVVELHFEGAAVAANGTILSLISAQSSASARAHLAVGNGTGVDAKPSEAAVEALIKRPNGNSLSAVEQNIKTGVRTYLGELQDKDGDGNKSIAFAVGGLNARSVVLAELVIGTGTVLASVLTVSAPAERIPDACELVGSALKKADGNALALATSSLVSVGGAVNGSACTIMGAFTVPTAANLEIAADKRVTLRLHCVN